MEFIAILIPINKQQLEMYGINCSSVQLQQAQKAKFKSHIF
jgi:hypothetical protein